MKSTHAQRLVKSAYGHVLLLILLLTASQVFAQTQRADGDSSDLSPAAALMPAPDISTTLEELRTFTDVIQVIREHYVGDVDDRSLMAAAITGMLESLDPHSQWISPEQFQAVADDAAGQYGGLGMDVQIVDGFLVIVGVTPGTPAARAKLHNQDKIVAIDGVSIRGQDLRKALASLRGAPGTQVELSIRPVADAQVRKLQLTRAIITSPSVTSQLVLDSYAHLRIEHFQQGTDLQLLEAFQAIRAKASGELQGLILDLRDNPGGIVESAVATVDLFIDEGLIVSARGRDERTDFDFSATRASADAVYSLLNSLPVVVLIDAGSASAAEIVAGALQDHQRAVLMGQTSYGKGSVQTILPLRNGSGLRLTTAQYFTPSGRSIQATGIVPDVVIPRVNILDNPAFAREADLQRRLTNPNNSPASNAGNVQPRIMLLSQQDYALAQAVNFLRALQVFQQ